MAFVSSKGPLACVFAAGIAALFGLASAGRAEARPRPKPAAAPMAPPAPVVIIPPRPVAPFGAANNVAIPPVGRDGLRETINARITPAQTTWNFRSAYNVAALNCRDPKYNDVLAGYRSFLRIHARGLAAANRAVDGLFRSRFGARFVHPREAYMTQVYNFYSFPPTQPQFCDAALAMSLEGRTVTPARLAAFAAAQLPRLDSVFENFFRSYEQYRIDVAAWDAKYAAPLAPGAAPGPSMASAPARTQ